MKRIIFLLLLFFSSTQEATARLGIYNCVTEKITTYENNNKEFIRKNLEKTFLVKIQKEKKQIILKTFSPSFSNSKKIYNIYRIDNTYGNLFSVETSSSSLLLDSLVFNELNSQGTIVIQSDFFVNSWKLKCIKN